MVKWSVQGQWNKVVGGAAVESNLEILKAHKMWYTQRYLATSLKNYDCSIRVPQFCVVVLFL